MGQLADRVKEISPFLRLEDGESVVVTYTGKWTEVANTFDPKKTLFQYELEFKGETKYFKSGNSKIALFFDKQKKGNFIKITRHGLDRETRYIVEESIDESGTLSREATRRLEEEMTG